MPELKDLLNYGPTIIILAMLLYKGLPIWKEVKFRELDVRHEEAAALTALSGSLGTMSSTVREIAVEQRRATDSVKLLQRVSVDSADSLSQTVADLTARLEELEGRNVESSRTGAQAH